MQQPLISLAVLAALIASSCGGQSETDAKRNPLVNDPAEPVASAEDGTAVGGNKDQAESDESTTQSLLCDGSDDVRFVFVQGGGFVGAEFRFTGVYGSRYLVIDGQCNFWLGTEGMAGLRTGHLEPSEGVAVSKSLQYGRYDSVADFQGGGCPDAGATYLFDGTARLVSFCGGSAQGAPDAWTKAFTSVFEEWQGLRERSTPSSGPFSLLVLESHARGSEPVAWSVNLKLEPLAITPDELIESPVGSLGTLIEDPETLQQLGQFRELALKADEYANGVTVEDGAGIYEVYVRDELPAKVATAIADVQRD